MKANAEDIEDEQLPPNNPDDGDDIGDAEAQARRMGWKPEAEFKGDKSKWVDAASFVRQAEEDAPSLRKTVHQLQHTLSKTERGMQQIISHNLRMAKQERQRGYDEAMSNLDQRLDAAVSDGDTAAARKITNSKTELARQQAQDVATPQEDGGADDAAALSDWKQDNAWYGADFKKTKFANEYEDFLAKKGVKDLSERLRLTAEEVEREFSEGGEDDDTPPPREQTRRAPAMMGRGGHRTSKSKPKFGTYEALRPENRADCDSYVRSMIGHGHKEDAARKMWLQYASTDMFVQ